MTAPGREDVLKIAALAKISLSEDEVERYTRDFRNILAFVAALEDAPLNGVEPLSHPFDVACPMREDETRESLPSAEALRGAPEAANGCFRVPEVIENE